MSSESSALCAEWEFVLLKVNFEKQCMNLSTIIKSTEIDLYFWQIAFQQRCHKHLVKQTNIFNINSPRATGQQKKLKLEVYFTKYVKLIQMDKLT